MTEVNDKPNHSLRVAIVLIVVVGAISTAVAYFGARESTNVPRSSPNVTAGTTLNAESIVLPQDEPELPSGPHQRTFSVSCTICHSTLLVMTQPPLARKQWADIVRKMIKTYGAPIEPEAEEQIVEYLTTVHGN